MWQKTLGSSTEKTTLSEITTTEDVSAILLKDSEKTNICEDDEFSCQSSLRCIISYCVCDGYSDCIGHENEKNCTENGQQKLDWSGEMTTSTEKVSSAN